MNLHASLWFGVHRSQHTLCADHRLRWIRALHTLAVLALACLMLPGSSGRAAAAERAALVMAVEDYQKLPRSAVGLKRATEIADALKARGFDVILSTNPGNAAARASLRDFAAKIEGADLALAVLIGHEAAWTGQSFFLMANTELSRATDLLSRALSVTNIAQIVSRARAGAVFFLMTVPDFGTPIEGVDLRPQFTGETSKNVVTVFSSSARVPVSRVDAVGEQAAEALAKLLRQPDSTLAEAVKTASNGEMGAIFGAAPDISMTKPPASAAALPASPSSPSARADRKGDADERLEAERQARELAERRARTEQLKTEQAQADVQRAQADARKAQADAERAQADARKAQADAEKAQAEAERMKLEAKRREAANQPPSDLVTSASTAPTVDESQLGRQQRQQIQERLREMGLYTGPIDSIMGPLTREGIMGYQKSRGATVTGYLTPDQFDALLSKAH